jgi:hypothetical protein
MIVVNTNGTIVAELICPITIGATVLDPTPDVVVLLDRKRAMERMRPQVAQSGSAFVVSLILLNCPSASPGSGRSRVRL